MIDSHCHLADPSFAEDLDAVLLRAKAAGVTTMVTIADSLPEAERCIAIAENYSEIFSTVGVHPHHAKDWSDEDTAKLKTLALSSKRVRAIGEIGLDYHYDFSPRETQRGVFRTQLLLAKELNMPAVVHCRDAVEDVWSIVEAVSPPRIVLHCCTEKFSDIERFLARGDFLSFTGMVTYPKATVIQDTVKQAPLDRMMIETDAPYLAPIPFRGKRNEPTFVVEVARQIATLRGISVQEVDAQTTKNTVGFFGLPLYASP
jgi:TatD DNase family protein